MRSKHVLVLLLLGFSIPAAAQLPILDIGMVPLESGQLEVRLRPDADFEDYFSSIQFAVRWPIASGAVLGEFASVVPYMQPFLSEQIECDGYNYAIYFGLGSQALSNYGASWTADEEVVLGHFEVLSGAAMFEIVNDDCTDAHNGTYYVSLNSFDQTGEIYVIPTSLNEAGAEANLLDIHPNPAKGAGTLSLSTTSSGRVSVEVFDPLGHCVFRFWEVVQAGSMTVPVALNGLTDGLYVIRVHGAGMDRSIPWVIQHR